MGDLIDKQAREISRLETALHAKQAHPDYTYSMTFEHNEAHTSRDGWELNTAIGDQGRETSVDAHRPDGFYWRTRVA